MKTFYNGVHSNTDHLAKLLQFKVSEDEITACIFHNKHHYSCSSANSVKNLKCHFREFDSFVILNHILTN